MNKVLNKMMNFVEKLNPKLNKISNNAWISGLQTAVLKIIPLTLVSTIVSIYDVICQWIPNLPNMDALSNYTFGISGMIIAILIPYYITEKIADDKKIMAAISSLGLFLMLMMPQVTEDGLYLFDFSWFGSTGMLTAIIVGMFVACIFNVCKNVSIFNEDSGMPDFCKEWFNTLLPMAIIFLIGWVITDILQLNLFTVFAAIMEPILANVGDTLLGVIFLEFIQVFIYTLGISSWLIYAPISVIIFAALEANMSAYNAGATMLPFVYAGFVTMAYSGFGGTGNTLPLNIFMLFSKNKRLKNMGKVFIVPSVMNINEPIVYSTVVWNPVLMIPSWLTTIVNMVVIWIAIKTGLVMGVHNMFMFWYAPTPIIAFFTGGIAGVLLSLVNLGLDSIIWYPFFKVYEKQCIVADDSACEAE